MARTQVGNIHRVTAIAGKDINGGNDIGAGFNDSHMLTIDAMRTRLTAIDGTAYSSSNLDLMTVNDMKYALRVHDNPTTVK